MEFMTMLRTQWDRSTAIGSLILGAVVMFLGWRGVSGSAYPAEQLPYLISAGLGGLFLLGISSALWLSADLRDEWRKLDRIEEALLSLADGGTGTDGSPAEETTLHIPSVGAERST